MYELVFVNGPRAGEALPINGAMLAGRSPECQIEVPDPNASRQHAKFGWDGSNLTLVDNKAANGTFVNEIRVTNPIQLKTDDVVRLGETRLRVQPCLRASDVPKDSVFGFVEADSDLGQSVVMSLNDLGKGDSPEAARKQLQAVLKAASLLKDVGKLEHILNSILEMLFELLPQAERGFLALGDHVDRLAARTYRLDSSRHRKDRPKQPGKTVSQEIGPPPQMSKSIARATLERRAAFLFKDQGMGGMDQGMSIVSLQIRSAIAAPLIVDDEVLGLLQLDTTDREHPFAEDDLALVAAFAQQAAMAVHNANLLEKVESETKVRQNLCRFLPGPVAQQVLDGSLNLNLGGATYPGTVLFSDVVGFTAMSETMPPDRVIALMNAYFERMVPCILGTHGAIDKFIGDAIMAFWGVPIAKSPPAIDACTTALQMQQEIPGFNSVQAEFGFPAIGQGIGLNSGDVVAGNIGTQSATVSYTLLGDTVNTASRIEHHAMREQVLVSDATWGALAGMGRGLKLPPVAVRNKKLELSLYALRALVQGDEMVLFVPVTIGEDRAWLIRRLADRTFVLLHDSKGAPGRAPLVSACAEWPGQDLGTAQVVETLTPKTVDGKLTRSRVRLADPDLAGLLKPKAVTCQLGWDRMVR
jgi:adenylate cyclase